MKIAHISLADWHQSVAGWPLELEGFYWRLVRFMYARNGLEDSDADNARMMGLDPRAYRRLKAQLVALGVIETRDGQLVNERVETELQRYAEHRERAAEGGRKGGIISGQNRALRGNLPRTSARTSPELLPEVHHVPCTPSKQNQRLAEPTPSPSPSPTKEAAAVAREVPKAAAAKIDSHDLYNRLTEAANGALYPLALGLQAVSEPIGWLAQGACLERDVLPAVKAIGHRARPQSIRSWSYFGPAVSEAKARREKGLPPAPDLANAKPKKPRHMSRY